MVSERRNELIAEMFHRVHFVEKWGRGISLILSKEPDAVFSEVGTKFITTFKRKSYTEGSELSRESSVKSSVKIIEAIKGDKNITAREIADNTGLTLRAVEKQLAKLKQEGVIRRIGPDKGGYWEIVKG